MSFLNLEDEFKNFLLKFENYQDFVNLIDVMDKFVARYKLSQDQVKFHEAVVSSNVIAHSTEEPENSEINFFHSIKLKYKANSSEDGIKSSSDMSNYGDGEEKELKSEQMDFTETRPKNERFNMKKAIHYLNKDNELIEQISDNFKSDEEYIGYAKSSLACFFPEHKFSFIKQYNSMINKKYYFECFRRKTRCKVKAIFIRQDGSSIFLICNGKHNHT